MRTLLVACIVLALPLTIMGTPTDTINVRLEDHQWEHRLLFVFAPTDSNVMRAGQEAAFEGRDPGFRERDLLVLTVTGQNRGTQRAAPGAEPVSARSVFDTIDAMPMRQREMREQDGGGE